MIKYSVCKTVVPYPKKRRFVLQLNLIFPHILQTFGTLNELAAELRAKAPLSHPRQETRFIKNEVPGDIVWIPDDTVEDRVIYCERLDPEEVHELARLLKK